MTTIIVNSFVINNSLHRSKVCCRPCGAQTSGSTCKKKTVTAYKFWALPISHISRIDHRHILPSVCVRCLVGDPTFGLVRPQCPSVAAVKSCWALFVTEINLKLTIDGCSTVCWQAIAAQYWHRMLPHYLCDDDMDDAFATAFSFCLEQCSFLGLSWIDLDRFGLMACLDVVGRLEQKESKPQNRVAHNL